MALPNDSLIITPGAGTSLATQTISGKEYEVVIPAGPLGHLTDSAESYTAWANDVAVPTSANASHISILNAAGSGKIIQLIKIFAVNAGITALVGSMLRFDLMRITAHSGGSTITPEKLDTANGAIPAQITVRTGATSVTEGARIFGFAVTNDEVGTNGSVIVGTHLLQMLNLLFESPRLQEFTLREGQGIHIKQVTAAGATGGLYGWILVFALK
jgi:hypothetical protein